MAEWTRDNKCTNGERKTELVTLIDHFSSSGHHLKRRDQHVVANIVSWTTFGSWLCLVRTFSSLYLMFKQPSLKSINVSGIYFIWKCNKQTHMKKCQKVAVYKYSLPVCKYRYNNCKLEDALTPKCHYNTGNRSQPWFLTHGAQCLMDLFQSQNLSTPKFSLESIHMRV